MMTGWNPWHGCRKHSEGCLNCYVYRRDSAVGRDARQVARTHDFDLPLRKGRDGRYKLAPGADVFACGTSDFFLEEADPWRAEAWRMIGARRDVTFLIITKRIARFREQLPADWGDGYPHVTIGCTCENQHRADERLPLFLDLPIAHRLIICEPLLAPIDLTRYLTPGVERVVAGGESGDGARVCDYDWVQHLAAQCTEAGTAFTFKQTGARFQKGGRIYNIPRGEQARQARRAGININDKGERESCTTLTP